MKIQIAYLGPPGSFSHEAATNWNQDATYVASDTFESIVDAVEKGDVNEGVLPIENSTYGMVMDVLDLLGQRPLIRIQSEIRIQINHCLIGHSRFSTQVSSHPQALGQCSEYLKPFELIHSSSTAAAVKQAALNPNLLAVGSMIAAMEYGVPIIERNIQNSGTNTTRFFVIRRVDRVISESTTLRISICFSIDNVPGALSTVLQVFTQHGVNIIKIESRPESGFDSYLFYMDVEGCSEDTMSKVSNTLKVRWIRVLGAYPIERIH
jgi:prephenate dehydratase